MNGPWGQLGPSEVLGMEKGRWKVATWLAPSAGNTLWIPRSYFSPLGEKISDGIGGTATHGEASPSFSPSSRRQIWGVVQRDG